MKSIFKAAAVVMLSIVISSCARTPAQNQIMRPLSYNQEMSVHVPKKAYIYWQRGQEQVGSVKEDSYPGLEGMVVAITQAQMRKSNPSKYNFSYSKAQQAVFITSLRDALADHHVFNNVELITNPSEAKQQDVLITVHFKSTRVAGSEGNFKITVTAVMTIKSNKAAFARTYLTESDEEKSYFDQQSDVSQQLLNKLMKGIKQWAS